MAVKFIGVDNVGTGDWIGKRGRQGRNLAADEIDPRWTDMPAWASVTWTGWTGTTSWGELEPLALKNPGWGTTWGVKAYYVSSFGQTGRAIVTATDGQPHLASIFCLDGTSTNRPIQIDVWDPARGVTVGTYSKSNFFGIEAFWVLAAFTGSVEFRAPLQFGGIGAIQGVFLDPYFPNTAGLVAKYGNWIS